MKAKTPPHQRRFRVSDGWELRPGSLVSAPSGSRDDWDDVSLSTAASSRLRTGRRRAERRSPQLPPGLGSGDDRPFMASPGPVPPSPSRVSMGPPSKASRRGSASATYSPDNSAIDSRIHP